MGQGLTGSQVIRPDGALPDPEGALEGRAGHHEVAQIELHPPEAVERGPHLRRLGAEHVLPDPERPLVERTRARGVAPLLDRHGECLERVGDVRVAPAERRLLDPERLLEGRLRLRVLAAPLEEAPEEVQGLGDFHVARSERPLPQRRGLARLGDAVTEPSFLQVPEGLRFEVPRAPERLVRRRGRGRGGRLGEDRTRDAERERRRESEPCGQSQHVALLPRPRQAVVRGIVTASEWPGTRPRRTPGRPGR